MLGQEGKNLELTVGFPTTADICDLGQGASSEVEKIGVVIRNQEKSKTTLLLYLESEHRQRSCGNIRLRS